MDVTELEATTLFVTLIVDEVDTLDELVELTEVV